jgi:hypothetical protein
MPSVEFYESKLLKGERDRDAPDERVVWEWVVRGLHGCIAMMEDLVIAKCPIDDDRLRKINQAMDRLRVLLHEVE